MNLRQNIIDSVKECEIKLGYREEAIVLYYPESVLLELLAVSKDALQRSLLEFCKAVSAELGEIKITETEEKKRYQVWVSKEGVLFVHKHIKASPFVEEFVQTIHRPGMTKEKVIRLFERYAKDVVVEDAGETEWAVYFADEKTDAYVYYIEEDVFGLQYHRFTRESYRLLKNS